MRRLPAAALAASILTAATGISTAQAAVTRPCRSVLNPYPDTRYAGADLSAIRATGVSCVTARRVVRGAHRKALGLTPSASGVRRFTWSGWTVTGDLRGASDRYVARRGPATIRWRF